MRAVPAALKAFRFPLSRSHSTISRIAATAHAYSSALENMRAIRLAPRNEGGVLVLDYREEPATGPGPDGAHLSVTGLDPPDGNA